jgi:hypothetical protein
MLQYMIAARQRGGQISEFEKGVFMTLTKKQQVIAVLLAFFVALSGFSLAGLVQSPQALAKTANYNTYTGDKASKDYLTISPDVVYSKAIKQYGSGTITYYTDSVNAVLVGQTLKIGFGTNKNESSASKKAYKKLQKSVKINECKVVYKRQQGQEQGCLHKKDL